MRGKNAGGKNRIGRAVVGSCLALALSLTGLSGCSKSSSEEASMNIELVIGVSGIDDRSFNQSSWDAIQKFAQDNNVGSDRYNYVHSMREEDYITNLSIAADKKPDIIVAPGYYFAEAMDVISEKYPEQKFVILDAASDRENVASVTFATHEGSFLAGISAGLKAKEKGADMVGFLGGVDIPIIEEFQAGFAYGVKTIDPSITLISEFANDYANPVLGGKLASAMYDKGAYIIFNVAGDTGNGLISEAKRRAEGGEDVWVVGVDKDQYEDGIYGDGKSSVILTSMMKKIDVATYDMLDAVKNGTFKGGHTLYQLSNQGVGLPDANPNMTEEWIKTVKDYEKKVIDGEIQVPKTMEEVQELFE